MGMAAVLRAVGRAAARLVYPPRCPFCDAVLGTLAECPACAADEHALRRPMPRLAAGDWVVTGLVGGAAVYQYEGVVRDAVLRMKFSGRACYAPLLAAQMAALLFGCTFSRRSGIMLAEKLPPAALGYSCVVSAPSSGRHACDPAGLLARELAGMLGLPYLAGALYKTCETPPQKQLDRFDRLYNLVGVIAVRPGSLPENSRVLLVDDVITTGGTVLSCAVALRKAGADEVFAACLAATEPGRHKTPRPAENEEQEQVKNKKTGLPAGAVPSGSLRTRPFAGLLKDD